MTIYYVIFRSVNAMINMDEVVSMIAKPHEREPRSKVDVEIRYKNDLFGIVAGVPLKEYVEQMDGMQAYINALIYSVYHYPPGGSYDPRISQKTTIPPVSPGPQS